VVGVPLWAGYAAMDVWVEALKDACSAMERDERGKRMPMVIGIQKLAAIVTERAENGN